MLSERDIFIEKFTDFLPTHMLCYENHTNYSFTEPLQDIRELEMYCTSEHLNFLGLAIPPYNPYGEDYNYAVVFEQIDHDYEVMWHHCSKRWINRMLKDLGCKTIQ